jgi:tetratricopeptide (TPR) repeat protein
VKFGNWFSKSESSGVAKEHFRKGMELAHNERWSEAIAQFSKAVDLNPSFTEALLKRGSAYCSNGQFDEAIEDFSKVLSINSTLPEACEGRAWVYTLKAWELSERFHKAGGKQFRLSFEELTMPMNKLLDSCSPDKKMWLRTTNELMELQYQAKLDAERALKLNPNNERMRQLLRHLSKL